jgi:hypothetical protein
MNPKPTLSTGYRIDRQQWRMRKTLIEIFHNHLGLIESQITIH